MPSQLSPQWLCANSCTWARDVGFHHVHPVPKCMRCHKVVVVITGRTHCFHDRNVKMLRATVSFAFVASTCNFDYDYLKIYFYQVALQMLTSWYCCKLLVPCHEVYWHYCSQSYHGRFTPQDSNKIVILWTGLDKSNF